MERKNYKQRRVEHRVPSDVYEDKGIPRVIQLNELVQARKSEISELIDSFEPSAGGKRVFQCLPRHLRRRTMSHNPYRLPGTLRAQGIHELAISAKKTSSKRRRNRKRRPRFALSEHQKRSAKHQWLETHIWHAKRMKMNKFWGFKIAEIPNDKSHRFIYKCSAEFSTIHDRSYMSTFALQGERSCIIKVLENIIPGEISEEATGRMTYHFYLPGIYPLGYVGPLELLWTPGACAVDQLLVWVHPSISSVFQELVRDNSHNVTTTDLSNSIRMMESWGPLSFKVIAQVFQGTVTETVSEHHQSLWQDLVNGASSVTIPDGFVIPLNVPMHVILNDKKRSDIPQTQEHLSSDQLSPLQSFKDTFADPEIFNNPLLFSVLLIRRNVPDAFKQLSNGWDIVFPATYSVRLWKALVYCGARAIGLHNRRRILLEAGLSSFPEDDVDCKAGRTFRQKQASQKLFKFLRTPPAKRINYTVSGFESPFSIPWNSLIPKDSSGVVNPHVIDNSVSKSELLSQKESDQLEVFPCTCVSEISQNSPAFGIIRDVRMIQSFLSGSLECQSLPNCFLRVEIDVPKGVPQTNSAILLDNGQDDDLINVKELSTPYENVLIGFVTFADISLARGKAFAFGIVKIDRLPQPFGENLQVFLHGPDSAILRRCSLRIGTR